MNRPDFLVIGAQKAATTTLWHHLRQHPGVFLPELKELNYFVDVGNWARGRSWYEGQFAPAAPGQRCGDVSPGYSMFPFYREAPERAAALVPDARIVYVVRHPVDRMVSSWMQAASGGLEDLDLEEAVLHRATYVQLSRYGMQLRQWAACFAREQLLVVRSEELAADPGQFLDRVLVHLGLAPGWRPADIGARHNESRHKPVARTRVRRVAGALRRLGFEGAARQLGPEGRVGHRLARPPRPDDLALDGALAAAFLECFHDDLGALRELVDDGDALDLWGLA